jgi:hypothetical protein
MRKLGIISAMMILQVSSLFSQDIEKILKSDPLHMSGQLRFDQYFNHQFIDSLSFEDQYALFLSGQFNAKIYSIDFPFQFSYTNKQEDYSHPFSYNQFGAQPFYKGVKLYLGYNSLTFSPYTLSGHQFIGAGIELTPKKVPFNGTIVYGRLIKPVQYDSTEFSLPAYDRRFYAFKGGYAIDRLNVSTSILYAWDLKESIAFFPDSIGVYPKENLALSLNGNYNITKQISVGVDIGRSILTSNMNSKLAEGGDQYFLITQRKSTRGYNAFGGQVKYALEKTSFGIQYKYIQPGFETLGAYYTNNDVEQISLTNTSKFLDGKINTNVNIGLERDNLEDDNMMTNQRFAGAFNISALPSDKLSLNASYSSFQSFSNMRSNFDYINSNEPVELMDTLNYRQVNQSVNLSGTYSLQGENVTNSTSLSLSGNTSGNTQQESGTGVVMLNSTLTHAIVFKKSKLSINASIFGSIVETTDNQITLGPVIGVGKSFWEQKIRTNLQVGANQTWNDTAQVSLNGNLSFQASLSLNKAHLITFTGSYIGTKNFIIASTNKSLQFRLSYSYRIQHTLIKRKRNGHDKKVP